MKKITLIMVILALAFMWSCRNDVPQKIDLSGEWAFAADPEDLGVTDRWYSQMLPEVIQLPGSMTSNGKGNDVDISTQWTGQVVDSSFFLDPAYARFREPGNFKVPFWLQPVKHYVGAAWYQKTIDIPAGWDGQYLELFLERCHWESRLWVNGQEAGMRNSLGTPHIFNLTEWIKPGKNTLTLCIDNRTKEIDPGINSHSISDHTQSNWNGITGQIHLEARPLVHISHINVYPDAEQKKALIRIGVANHAGSPSDIRLELTARGAGNPGILKKELMIDASGGVAEVEYPLGNNIALWDEFDPNLYELEVRLKDKIKGTTDSRKTTFGVRSFVADGQQLTINGRPIFLRGTLECAIFPKTGYPPTDTESWARIISICKNHGLNHMRFHSWCPPKAAFEAADQAGFYLQVEASSWANQSTTLGDGKPFDQYLYEETERMMEQYGNHPSFVMMAYGNEPGGPRHREFLTEYVTYWKKQDPRRLYVSGAGWPNLEVNDFLNDPAPRIQAWGSGLNSLINREPPRSDYDWSAYAGRHPQPVVSHEIGQWCVYPNFREIEKYDGVLKARNFEIFRETLGENGMAHLADSFLQASGKLQALCYKADIEAALRTKPFGGFQLLDLHDFPGQGTALVGILDPFWEEKGYITPEEFSRFCNTTVPLARMPGHIFTNAETFSVPVEIAHYGKSALTGITPVWKVYDANGQILKEGSLQTADIPLGNGTKLGVIEFPLSGFNKAARLILEVSAAGFSNTWDFWVYPSVKDEIADAARIRIIQQPDAATLKFLEEGGTALLHLKKGTLSDEAGGNIGIGFSSIFWNTAWTRGQKPHTLGVLCNPEHPALADFPTQFHSNWQWWDAMSHSGAINLTNFPSDMKPIVRVIDDWFTNRPLALIVEAKVGKGKLLISGIDFSTNIENRPEAQQLLYSLTKYMAGEKFNPQVEVTADLLKKLIK
ncbi:MAG: glycoside hydrolase family 2 protein [Bacteroidota bacterium]|mgnify:CR=1 FL=1